MDFIWPDGLDAHPRIRRHFKEFRMFPFWCDLSSGMVETLAVVIVAATTWLMQFLGSRGC